jgi:hypothetical protein
VQDRIIKIDVIDADNEVAKQLHFMDEDLASPRNNLMTEPSKSNMDKNKLSKMSLKRVEVVDSELDSKMFLNKSSNSDSIEIQ